jgi:4-hydroxy-4-methyl-2-oxoglutarate aldolase
MGTDITGRLMNCYSGAVFDVLREKGITRCVLPPEITPLDSTKKMAGEVFTVSGHLDLNLDPHETLLRWTDFLSRAPSGSVVVCQPNDHTIAHMGELSAETLQFKGVNGYVVDGGTRDSEFILKLGFPVFARYKSPRDVVGAWVPDSFGEDIKIGDVDISNGDYVFGDLDGVLIIPSSEAQSTVERVEEVMSTENLVRKAILQGIDPKEAYLSYGLF